MPRAKIEKEKPPHNNTVNAVIEIPLTDLHPPDFNPFHITDDGAMISLVESIKQRGVLEPGLARPNKSGGYELLIGNRRKRACELAGLETIPVIIRELDDNDATIAMVDSNLEQREELLFSEKAWAYRIKMEALNHKGVKSSDGKLSVEVLSEQFGDSKNQIFRYIRLTELFIELLNKLDKKELAFTPAVELSYLSHNEQIEVASIMDANDISPSLSQAVRLKKLKQSGELTIELIHSILSENKPKLSSIEREIKRFRRFFPAESTPNEIYKVITNLLEVWKDKQKNIAIETSENFKYVNIYEVELSHTVNDFMLTEVA